jgi:hypothetical protein
MLENVSALHLVLTGDTALFAIVQLSLMRIDPLQIQQMLWTRPTEPRRR